VEQARDQQANSKRESDAAVSQATQPSFGHINSRMGMHLVRGGIASIG
jgi:hypothetical protein